MSGHRPSVARSLCDVAHAERYAEPRAAAYDLGQYMRVVGIPGRVRFLCEACAVGRIPPRFKDRFRLTLGATIR